MLTRVLGFADSSLLLISFVLILLYWNRLNTALKFFGAFIGLSFLVQTSAFTIPYLIKGYNNFWLLHLLTLGEFIFLSLFYYHLFKENDRFQKFIRIFLPIVSLLIISNSIFLEPITGYNSNAKALTQLFIISYAIYYFYIVSTKEILTDNYNKALHIINSGILLYYAGSLFIFMFGKIAMDIVEWKLFLIFNATLYFIFLIIVLIGLWKVIFKQQN